MQKHRTIFFLFAATLFLATANGAFAQSSNVQKAFENVKGSLDSLITAKDETNASDLSIRIETYRKVLDLSLAEAKDLKVKLLAFEEAAETARFDAWKKSALDALDASLSYLNDQKKLIADEEKTLTVQGIKSIAEKFKEWRENKYSVAAESVRDFLITQQQADTLRIARQRLQKIADDVARIQRAKIKGSGVLSTFLSDADSHIRESEQLNDQAYLLFKQNNFPLDISSSTPTSTPSETTSTATSTPSEISSTIIVAPEVLEENATGTPPEATSTTASSSLPTPPPPSIRDLVRESLLKTKDAYQIFIEMSSVVRDLLK